MSGIWQWIKRRMNDEQPNGPDLIFRTARAIRADGYDFRFVCVRPVFGSMGAEMCVWMTFH
jgi:hypothetical protein